MQCEEIAEALSACRPQLGVVTGSGMVVAVQGRFDIGWLNRAVRHDQRRDQLGQVVSERREGEVVRVDAEDRAVLGDQEVPRVAVLVKGGRPFGGALQQRQHRVQCGCVGQKALLQPLAQGYFPTGPETREKAAVPKFVRHVQPCFVQVARPGSTVRIAQERGQGPQVLLLRMTTVDVLEGQTGRPDHS